jgi:hypothetical protein
MKKFRSQDIPLANIQFYSNHETMKKYLSKNLQKLPEIILLLTSYSLLFSNPVLADRFTDQIGVQLIEAAKHLGLEGYQLTHDPFIDELGSGREDDISITLDRGTSYAIVGVCDEDCNDIDLALYDDNGRLVASDVQKDDIPFIKVEPRWNARFTIRVLMPSCGNSPCRYGIGVMGK